jgi:hypothetical protein
MKGSSSDFLVILVLLLTLIGGGAALHLFKMRAGELVPYDLILYDDFPSVDISLAQDDMAVEDFPCYRIDLK